MVLRDRTRGNRHKLKHRKLCLNIRKHFVTVRVTEHWDRLPRDVESLSLEIFSSYLDLVVDNLLLVTVLEQGAGPNDFQRSLPNSTILGFCEKTVATI